MDFTNQFSVKAPLPLVWQFLLDAQEVAPCVPGAQITEVIDETHYKGTVKVKLGAVQMTYRGELEMEPNEAERLIVLHAKGTETRGSGGASGTSTATVTEAENGETQVRIVSQVDVSGRVAQFGRGIMQDVANRILKDFSACLQAKLEARIKGGSPRAETDVPPPNPSIEPEPVIAETVSASGAVSSSGQVQSTPPEEAAPTTTMTPSTQAELRVSVLMWSITRSRLAAALRALADRLEPR